jgi:hypothetical protein
MAPAILPLEGAIVVYALCVGVLFVVFLRTWLRSYPGRAATSRTGHETEDVGADARRDIDANRDLRTSRLLFYLGTLTVTESSLRPALGLSISEIFFIAALVGCVLAGMRGHRVPLLPTSLVLGVSLFALGGSVSTLAAQSPGGSAAQVLHAVYVMLLWTWTGAMVLRTPGQLFMAIVFWSISAAVNGVAAIAQVLHTPERAKGLTVHPNDLGGAAAVALIPALMVATTPMLTRGGIVRGARWVTVALVAVAIFLSGSVAAMVAGLVATVIWLASPAVRAPGRAAA